MRLSKVKNPPREDEIFKQFKYNFCHSRKNISASDLRSISREVYYNLIFFSASTAVVITR